ncbi:hypothetical protein L873DRAFT_502970 [Choiromyces venosus 120613-1]|uniref:Uncharacterized protein n=1 Tax=Choiromyces venosus 120613-1 TaxID=1336337 RepID=A0A3N4J0L6_9PEZI|nr:hypothetical protein L873DRAFT_502970 [Choiromyces venosus 120613-1]
MNTGSLPSGNRGGQQPEEERHATIPEGHEPTSGNLGVVNPAAHVILSPLCQLAQVTRDKIESMVSLLPHLAAHCVEYLTQEMQYVADAYSRGVTNEHPAEAQKQIEEAIARMEAFYNDVVNRWPALRAGRRRVISESTLRYPVISLAPGSSGQVVGDSAMTARPQSTPSGFQLGIQLPVGFVAANPSSQAGESGAMATRQEQAQQKYQPSAVLLPVPENNPTKHGMMDPRANVPFTPQPLARRATLGAVADDKGIPGSPTVIRVRRSLTLRSVVGVLRRTPGESKRVRVKDLWKRARDLLRKPDPNT